MADAVIDRIWSAAANTVADELKRRLSCVRACVALARASGVVAVEGVDPLERVLAWIKTQSDATAKACADWCAAVATRGEARRGETGKLIYYTHLAVANPEPKSPLAYVREVREASVRHALRGGGGQVDSIRSECNGVIRGAVGAATS